MAKTSPRSVDAFAHLESRKGLAIIIQNLLISVDVALSPSGAGEQLKSESKHK